MRHRLLVLLVCQALWLVPAEVASAQASPAPCPPNTEYALGLSAPSTIFFGAKQLVVVSASSGPGVSSGNLQMRRLSDSAPYFSHTFTADDLWNLNHNFNLFYGIVLTKSDGPVQITLTDVQSESSSSSSPQCLEQVSTVTRPVRPPVPRIITLSGANPTDIGAVEREPRRIVYSGDGAALLAGSGTVNSHLHWTTWNRHIARATGSDWHDNCVPDCARGTYSAYPVKVRAYRPRFVEGYLVFTRIAVTYTGARPPYSAYRRGWMTYRLQYDPRRFQAFWK